MRTQVGDRYVVEKMVADNYNLGGEQSGHILFLDHNTTGDGAITCLQMLALMVEKRQRLSELKRVMTRLPQVLLNVNVKERKDLAGMPKVSAKDRRGGTRFGGTRARLGALFRHRVARASHVGRRGRKKDPRHGRGYRRSDPRGGWQVVMIRLGVNVDHVATVRQARRAEVPDPVAAALLAEKAGADGITVHLREDRRHIQERDVERLRERTATKINLEMAVTPAMVEFAERTSPRRRLLRAGETRGADHRGRSRRRRA